jgi:glycosyltransferase involved in cell wall biosynthesis
MVWDNSAKNIRIAHYFLPGLLSPGGVETHIYELISHLRVAGADVTLVSDGSVERFDGTITTESMSNQKFDVIHTHGSFAGGLPKSVRQIPRVHTLHGTSVGRMLAVGEVVKSVYRTVRYRRSALTASWIEMRAARSAGKCICVSHATAREARKYFRVRPENIEVVPSSFTPHRGERLEKSVAKTRIGAHPDDTVVLFVGRDLDPVKGASYFLKAATSLARTNLRFVMVPGDSVQAGDHMIAPGPIDHADMGIYFQAADIYVLPSLYEGGWAIALQEAMSFDVAPIASRLGSITELLTDGQNALLVEPQNVDQLTNAIRTLYDDHETRRRIALSAAESVMKFTWNDIANQTLDIYAESIRNKAGK